MKSLKPVAVKKTAKKDRMSLILIGLIDHYLKTGKPVGSETLREEGFQDLSSATIRNYFSSLVDEGFLCQLHTSAGRIPTDKAWRFYAGHVLQELKVKKIEVSQFPSLEFEEGKELKAIIAFLQKMTEKTSELAQAAAFISAPRFDQDYVVDMKLVSFDGTRILAVLLTNFGLIHTELLHSDVKLSAHALHRIESYFRSRISASPLPVGELEKEEIEIAHRFYQEAMARYLVRYSHFAEEEIYRAGFSRLLRYPEFQQASQLASSLSLFENKMALGGLMRETLKIHNGQIKYWIGKDLHPFLSGQLNSALIMCPYRIGQKQVGCLGIIGPMRMRYKELFILLQEATEQITKTLTGALLKYKISYRTPSAQALVYVHETSLLLEDQT